MVGTRLVRGCTPGDAWCALAAVPSGKTDRCLPCGLPPQPAEDEQTYADVANELNDGAPTDMTLADLDQAAVEAARRYAQEHCYPWPPSVGDYDRYCERKRA